MSDTDARPMTGSRASKRAAILTRWRGANHPDVRAAKAEAAELLISEYITRTVARFPKLSPEQVDRVATILRNAPTRDDVRGVFTATSPPGTPPLSNAPSRDAVDTEAGR
jgi:hypothetical protein